MRWLHPPSGQWHQPITAVINVVSLCQVPISPHFPGMSISVISSNYVNCATKTRSEQQGVTVSCDNDGRAARRVEEHKGRGHYEETAAGDRVTCQAGQMRRADSTPCCWHLSCTKQTSSQRRWSNMAGVENMSAHLYFKLLQEMDDGAIRIMLCISVVWQHGESANSVQSKNKYWGQ